jgi:hypothetical protein
VLRSCLVALRAAAAGVGRYRLARARRRARAEAAASVQARELLARSELKALRDAAI